MAQRKSNLKSIAAEGFAMLDEFQYVHKYQQPKSKGAMEVVSIDSYQAAQMYGGILIAEYRKNKKPFMRLPKFYN